MRKASWWILTLVLVVGGVFLYHYHNTGKEDAEKPLTAEGFPIQDAHDMHAEEETENHETAEAHSDEIILPKAKAEASGVKSAIIEPGSFQQVIRTSGQLLAAQGDESTAVALVAGIVSLRGVRNLPLYVAYSVGIWVAYFLHFYLAFFCFDFTSGIGPGAALAIFCVGSFAVLVPTPNGAGPWHFAVKTMLVLYGVDGALAADFALVVHTLQTMLVVVLGIYALVDLPFIRRRGHTLQTADNP